MFLALDLSIITVLELEEIAKHEEEGGEAEIEAKPASTKEVVRTSKVVPTPISEVLEFR